MKKLLLFVICSVFYCSYAQLPPNSFGEDFTLTDINGNEFNLYEVLDDGKTVILDLFAVWCGPCWSFAEAGTLEALQEEYPDDVVCVAVEADSSTPENTIFGGGNSVGDWTTIIDYLMMDDPSGDVAEDYALAYYPTIYKICPDRMVTEVGQLSSVNAFMGEVNQCSSAEYSKDAKILSYGGSTVYCGGELEDASVKIQNYSVGATLTNCDILTKVNGEVVETTPWSGSLDLYQTADVNIGSLSGLPDNADIEFELDYPGDMDDSNNTLDDVIVGATASSQYVSLYIMTDNWGYETSWELLDESGSVVDSGSDYGNYEVIEIDWTLDNGCYTFHVYDTYGDGVEASMWGSYEDGVVTISDGSNDNIIWTGVQFEAEGVAAFEVGAMATSILESSNTDISIFPNPFKDYTNISISSDNEKEISIEIYNNLGKVVYNKNILLTKGTNNIKLESGDLTPGLYYINSIIDNENNIQPLTIVQ